MALVIRESDMKLISVSKKKLVVYESCYTAPLSFSSDRLRLAIEQGLVEPTPKDQPNLAGQEEQKTVSDKPRQVQSIKSMRDHITPRPNTTASSAMRSPTELDESAATQFPSLGEGVVVPEHASYDEDLATGINALKQKAETTISDPGIRARVLKSIKTLEDAATNVVPRGLLK